MSEKCTKCGNPRFPTGNGFPTDNRCDNDGCLRSQLAEQIARADAAERERDWVITEVGNICPVETPRGECPYEDLDCDECWRRAAKESTNG